MRWMKHMSRAHEDEAMAELIAEYGPEGYGVWWIILEKIAAQMDKTQKCYCRYPVRNWATSCGISPKKFRKIAEKLSKLGKVEVSFEENFCSIACLNLLKFRDEYTKKSGQTPDKVQTDS
jgi:hypothetical protein